MTEQLEGQMSIFDLDIWCGKTYQAHSPQTTEKTSESSLKRPQKSAIKMPLFLDLTASGATPDASWETDGVSLGAFMMHSTTAYRKEDEEYVCFATSTDTQRHTFYLTLNCGEKPRIENKTRLSDILEESPGEKYTLSARACQGILNRAERRGKKLPEQLEAALRAQAALQIVDISLET